MIDFTKCERKNKGYGGANGSKLCIIIDNEKYMLKLPPMANINPDMHYANGCVSEYIGCHIYESIGIPVQKTILGTFSEKGKEKIAVACKDIESPGIILQDFATLKNKIIDSERNGYGTELNDILYSFDNQYAIDPTIIENRFWDMFIIDAYIGNWDRHNGNWGILYNESTDSISLAPVYDCGSSMYPQADSTTIKLILNDKNELETRIYNRPLSAILENGKKINYFDFISSLKNEECNKALTRIIPKINSKDINLMIDNIECISEEQKYFYKLMLKERKEKILDYSLNKLMERQCNKYISFDNTLNEAKQKYDDKNRIKNNLNITINTDQHNL